MTENDIFMAYIPQIAELMAGMSMEDYDAWKREIRETIPEKASGFMEKIFMVTDHLVLV